MEDGARVWSRPVVDLFGFDPDGDWLLLQDADRDLKRFETATGVELPFAAQFRAAPHELAVAPDAALTVVAVVRGQKVELFDWKAERVLGELEHSAPLHRIVWQDNQLAASDNDGNIVVWTLPAGSSLVLRGHRAGIASLQFIPGTTYLLSVSHDGETFCWDAAEGDLLLSSSRFMPGQVSPDGRYVIYGTPIQWGWTSVLPPVGRTRFRCDDVGEPAIRQLVFGPDSRTLAVVKQAGVHLYDLQRQRETAFLPLVGSVAGFFVPGTNLFVAQGRFEVRWFQLPTEAGTTVAVAKPLQVYRSDAEGWFEPGALSPDGRFLVLPRPGHGLEWVGLRDGRFERRDASPGLTAAVTVGLTDSWVALRHGGDSAIVLFPPGRPDESRWLGKDDAMPRFSPDGRWLLASGRHDHRFYRVGDWQPVHPESVAGRLQNATLAASAWTADSRLVALALDRNQLLLLKSGTWEEVVRLTTPQPAAFVALAFSPGNRWLAAGTGGGSVELWDLAELSTALAPMGLHLDQPVHDGEASLPDPRPERLPVSVKLPQNPASGYPPRSSEAGPGQLDLTPFFNARLDSSWGETDKDGIRSSLGELPVGLSRFNGVMFDVRGLVQLAGERFKDQSQRFPAEVTGIPIPQGMTRNRLHFLGAVLDGLPSIVRGGEVARVRFRYLDGGRREFPLRLGSELEDWWSKPRRPLRPANATVGWRGLNLGSENSGVSLQLYHVILPNPEPGRLVESVDIFSVGAAPSPFFVGLTVD